MSGAQPRQWTRRKEYGSISGGPTEPALGLAQEGLPEDEEQEFTRPGKLGRPARHRPVGPLGAVRDAGV